MTKIDSSANLKFKKDNWIYKRLSEIVTITRGEDATKEQMPGNYPAIRTEDISGDDINYQFDECVSFVNKSLIKDIVYCKYGDILMTSLGKTGKTCIYLGNQKCIVGNNIYKMNRFYGNPKYLSYALSSREVKEQIKKFTNKGSAKILFVGKTKEIKVPIPPIDVQDKIADFLDGFSEKERVLRKQIKELNKQYLYYFKEELEVVEEEHEEEPNNKAGLVETIMTILPTKKKRKKRMDELKSVFLEIKKCKKQLRDCNQKLLNYHINDLISK